MGKEIHNALELTWGIRLPACLGHLSMAGKALRPISDLDGGWWRYQFHPQWQLVSSACKMTVSWAEGTLQWWCALHKEMLNLSCDYGRHIGDRWGSVYNWWVPSGLREKEKMRGRTLSCIQALWPQPLFSLLGWIPFDVWITTNCGKFLKRWEHQTTWFASWEICMQVKKQQLELNMKQQTDSK